MAIEYTFEFSGEHIPVHFIVPTERGEKGNTSVEAPAEWTRLAHCQCSNCPLKKTEVDFCPAALDIQKVVEEFSKLPAFHRCSVTVKSPERLYHKDTTLEEGLRSLMGLLMASSGCPILNKNKPMAATHLPFASQNEFITRSVGTYLLRQYYRFHDGGTPDWNLDGLIELNRNLQLVNQAMWQRIHSVCSADSNLKAMLSFFTLSSSVSYSLETQLQKIRPTFMEQTDISPFEKTS